MTTPPREPVAECKQCSTPALCSERGCLWVAVPAPSAAQPAEPTMDDAIAAGDGTLHGAIDYWQGVAQSQAREIAVFNVLVDFLRNVNRYALERAERAEAERDALRECVKAADAMRKERELTWIGRARFMDAYDAARAKVRQ